MNRFQRNYPYIIYVNRSYRNGFYFFWISSEISSNGVQKLAASSRWSIFTHKDTEKNQKSKNFETVLNRRETSSRVYLAKIWGL